MERLFLAFVCGGFLTSAAMAADPYEEWLTLQQQRGTQIEFIRVASQKALVATEETDEEVASILDELEAIEEESNDSESSEES